MNSLHARASAAAAGMLFLAAAACQAAELTATEARWLQGIWPVVVYARDARLPLDIIVQPQATPGASPLALGFVDGRCKLVLSMRGNPQAETTLAQIEPGLLAATLQLMAAHELGHCRRYLDGAWYQLPAGFSPAATDKVPPELRVRYLEMKAARSEEAYGDLVGLAWTQQHHPQHYARLHAWLFSERTRDLIPGSHHDTLAWLRLAGQGMNGAGAGASIFVVPAALWAAGLAAGD